MGRKLSGIHAADEPATPSARRSSRTAAATRLAPSNSIRIKQEPASPAAAGVATPAARGRKRKAIAVKEEPEPEQQQAADAGKSRRHVKAEQLDATATGPAAASQSGHLPGRSSPAAAAVKAEPTSQPESKPAAVKSEPASPGGAASVTARKGKVKVEDWAETAHAAKAKAGSGSKAASAGPDGPFPAFQRPLPEECRAARDALAALHGAPQIEEVEDSAESKVPANGGISSTDPQQRTVLDSLVRTILSQNTTDVTSAKAFKSLKAAFPTWESVRVAAPGTVEESIRCGGLADVKVERIRAILNSLLEERGDCSLEYLRAMDDEAIKKELTRFKGVGPKTVACVLMFCLRRSEFPVDTHVWRISKSLGWVPPKATREQAYSHLNLRVPDDVKYDLHVLLVRHGKRCPRCASNGKPRFASDGPCPLTPVMLKGSSVSPLKGAAEVDVKSEADSP